jgi:peptide/nickel transport system permease protein
MRRYALRRLWQLIPTLAGVIVITFILFNVVGGSPATLTLGKNVSPKMLEDFDEQHGFNKPLFFGFWTGTRAYASDRATPFPPGWRKEPGASVTNDPSGRPVLVLEGEGPFEAPVLFALPTNSLYRWTVVCAGTPGATVEAIGSGGALTVSVAAASAAAKPLEIETRPEPGGSRLVFRPGKGGRIEIRRLALERRMSNPLNSQFVHFLGRMARLDFGESIATGQPVLEMLREGMGPSLVLMIPIFAAELLLAVALSLVCAYFRNTATDRFIVVFSVVLMSVNYLVWIVAGQYVFAHKLKWFPIWGFESWRYLLLPWLIGTFSGLGGSVRFYRTIMLDEMYRDYVRTAFAKGLGLRDVLFKHVLKNAMIPIVTNVVMAIPFLYTGSLLLESFFGIPGLGYLSVNALNSLDVDVVRAVVVIGTVLYILANLASDLCYALVDPRVRLE